mgnify:CR=1 FL=1
MGVVTAGTAVESIDTGPGVVLRIVKTVCGKEGTTVIIHDHWQQVVRVLQDIIHSCGGSLILLYPVRDLDTMWSATCKQKSENGC